MKKELYISFVYYPEQRRVSIVAMDTILTECIKDSELRSNAYKIFNYYDDFNEKFISWLNEFSFTRLEGRRFIEGLNQGLRERFNV